jgi:D-glycero-alpha-D-manno-heptose 1-phosphate guanylyltransferase
MGDNYRITRFSEKQFYKSGNINGGIYFLRTKALKGKNLPAIFSFEKDYLEKYIGTDKILGVLSDDYFIDIGIPEDYDKANRDLKVPPIDLEKVDDSWTLFLDRDGVINEDAPNDYIKNLDEFHIYPYALGSIKKLSNRFGKIFIVSNQRGVGRKLMKEADLHAIHEELKRKIIGAGGRIDAIYYCTATDNKELCRKPNPGMAFQAKKDFPNIDLSKALMVGNKLTDMLFAKYAGMYSVFLTTTNPETPFPHPDIDLRYNTLADFANSL